MMSDVSFALTGGESLDIASEEMDLIQRDEPELTFEGGCDLFLQGGANICMIANEPEMALYDEYQLEIEDACNLTLQVGASGKDGADGQDGVDGQDGTDGQDGVDGVGLSPIPLSVEDETTYEVAPGKQLLYITVLPESGARVLTIGYSSGAGDLIDTEDISSNDSPTFPCFRYFHNGKTLYFSGFSGNILLAII